MRILLQIAYDGTNYSGFQSQTNAVAIQDVLEDALSDLFGKKIRTAGASRTDTGVHARSNYAAFDVDTRIAPSKIAFALNARLPEDIRIMRSVEVSKDFHPRFSPCEKTYCYRIYNARFPDPLLRLYTLHYYYDLDAEKMNEAASYLVGPHDFASFCSAGYTGRSTVRTLYSSVVERDGDLITYTVTGDGFLYNMIRIIAGTLIRIGGSDLPAEEMLRVLEARDRAQAGDTALAKGLTLENIAYL